MKLIILSLTLIFSTLSLSAKIGDEIPIKESQIEEIKVDKSTTKDKSQIKYIVIYRDSKNKKKKAYMTKKYYDIYIKCKRLQLEPDLFIIEMRTINRIVIK